MLNIPQPLAIAVDRIHPDTLPGYVHLKVIDLDNQVMFYQQAIGLQLNWKKGNSAGLGIEGRDLVRMTQIANGRRYRGVTGIYHFAILFPNRRELARVVARLFSMRWQNYPTDHIMTKTTYVDDPEGNTIELYCESPEDGISEVVNGEFVARHADGRLSDGREPLDLDKLFSHLKPEDRLDLPVPPQTRMGHFHLYVADLTETHFAMVAALKPEIVLLGTGARQQFPLPRLLRPLLTQGIGVEVMDTAAACRTYNIIMLEGRRVAAALLMIEA